MTKKPQTTNKTRRLPAKARQSSAAKTKNSTAEKVVTINLDHRKLLSLPVWPKIRLVIALEIAKPGKKTKVAKNFAASPAFINKLLKSASPPVIMLILGGITGLIYFSVQAIHPTAPAALYSPPVPQNIQASKAKNTYKALPKSEPTRVRVPSIGIDTPLMALGRNQDGTMEVPPLGAETAGWYKYAPTPGEVGPAVIAGHVDTYRGPAVFFRLKEMKPGEIIEVARTDGKTAKFKVDTIKQFPQDSFPTQEVYGSIAYSGLRLITCGGSFNRVTQQYDSNTVVFASLITEQTKL